MITLKKSDRGGQLQSFIGVATNDNVQKLTARPARAARPKSSQAN
jgi:hypothetical protein